MTKKKKKKVWVYFIKEKFEVFAKFEFFFYVLDDMEMSIVQYVHPLTPKFETLSKDYSSLE